MRDAVPAIEDLNRLWAKGAPANAGDAYHPLLFHLFDVAAVAELLWQECVPDAARRWFGQQLGLAPAAAGRWACFLAAAHDVGKAMPAFQRQQRSPVPPRHGTVSAVTLEDLLSRPPHALDADLALALATVVGGHHGIFPRALDCAEARKARASVGGLPWDQRRAELVRRCAEHVGGEFDPPTRLTAAGAAWLAGFVSVADWVASNADFYPFAAGWDAPPGETETRQYAGRGWERARDALRALGWPVAPRRGPAPSFAALFPFSPNDVQQAVIAEAAALDGPTLAIVEAPMGDGKTEAAWYLVERGSAEVGLGGAYVALPTMATSNQMFGRVAAFLRRRGDESPAHLQLLHGHAALSADFRALRDAARAYLGELCIPPDPGDRADDRANAAADAPPGVIAASWFTARKRGLLAPYGVGTVDQALLSVLSTRHFFVRLFGLAGKTVVVDEVHAYDAYMSVLLERLLAWLAAMGTSVVLLSATLPRARRERLVRAYLDGLAPAVLADPPPASADTGDAGEPAYPLLTVVAEDARRARPVAASALATKSLHLAWRADGGADPDHLGPALRQVLANGGCAAVICNTVRAAQRLYAGLGRWFAAGELLLLHARFLYDEREQRERNVLSRFGPPAAGVQRPFRAVVVATQVIEQSLDLDFDLMATELAPVDLVLQRAGRLHRHRRPRPAGLTEPSLWILGPAEREGAPVLPPADCFVYDEHVLLRSWLALRERARLAVPADVAGLVEAVYGDRPCPAAPESALAVRWEATRRALDERLVRDRREAERRIVPPPAAGTARLLGGRNQDLDEEDPDLHPTLQALTRLGEQTVTAICLTPAEVREHRPRASDAPSRAEALLRRSVRLSHPSVVHDLAATNPPASWRTTALLRYCRLVELDDAGTSLAAFNGRRLRVDPALGVTVEAGEEDA